MGVFVIPGLTRGSTGSSPLSEPVESLEVERVEGESSSFSKSYVTGCRSKIPSLAGIHPLIPFQHIFSFYERKLDISNFAGKLLTVYNMTRSCLIISSSSWKAEKKSSKGALKLEVPKMPKMS
jgi:hypothetical protein